MAPERWDRDRFYYELDRERDRDRHNEVRERFEEDDRTSVFTSSRVGRPGPRLREHSVDTERFERRFPSRGPDDDVMMRERRVVYDERDERLPPWRRRPLSPPESDFDRRVVIEKERIRSPSPAPLRRPPVLRRQSSLDTFDRRRYYERDEYGPPARRGDYRAPPYVPIPLPRSRALPPPRVVDREYYDEIQVSDPYFYGDDDFHAYPERMREKEIIRTKRHDRARSVRSVSSSSSRSSSSTSVTTAKSEYPKKGKTRIPMRLVSKRALIDLGYPFVEEGNTIVIQKALGQQNIDEVLKLSEDYKKSELEIAVARSSAGDVVEEHIEERREEVIATNGPAVIIPSAGGPNIITVGDPPDPSPVEVVNTTTIVRDISPARSHRSHRSRSTSVSHGPVIIDARPREVSEEIQVGPLALVERNHHHRPRSLSRGAYSVSTTSSDIRSEIRHLERELARRDHYQHRRDRRSGGELVRAERLSNGELVLFEEKVERIEEPSRGVRIEKDRKGPPPKLMKAMLATLT